MFYSRTGLPAESAFFMVYNPKDTFTHRYYNHKRLEEIYHEAVKWQELTYIPYLLIRWQKDHPKDVKDIAGYCSCKLEKHRWCEGENHLYFAPTQIPIFKDQPIEIQPPVPTDVDTNNRDNIL